MEQNEIKAFYENLGKDYLTMLFSSENQKQNNVKMLSEMTVEAFQQLLGFYKNLLHDEQKREYAKLIEKMVFNHEILPKNVKKAELARRWNNILCSFIRLSGKAEDDYSVQSLVFNWWNAWLCSDFSKVSIIKQIKKTNLYTANSWKGVLSAQVIKDRGFYGLLLHSGEIETLAECGQIVYLFNMLEKISPRSLQTKVLDIVVNWMLNATVTDLQNYLSRNPKHLFVFTLHPLGLKCLVENECFGAIAAMAKDFRFMAEFYPAQFSKLMSKEDYVKLLDYALDENVVK